jgi:hypothetical protein
MTLAQNRARGNAPRRFITTTLQPATRAPSRGRHLDIRFLFGLRRLQQQLGREILMRSRLPPRLRPAATTEPLGVGGVSQNLSVSTIVKSDLRMTFRVIKPPGLLVFDCHHCYFLMVVCNDISITRCRTMLKVEVKQRNAFGDLRVLAFTMPRIDMEPVSRLLHIVTPTAARPITSRASGCLCASAVPRNPIPGREYQDNRPVPSADRGRRGADRPQDPKNRSIQVGCHVSGGRFVRFCLVFVSRAHVRSCARQDDA